LISFKDTAATAAGIPPGEHQEGTEAGGIVTGDEGEGIEMDSGDKAAEISQERAQPSGRGHREAKKC
jgi:hypothetical protein